MTVQRHRGADARDEQRDDHDRADDAETVSARGEPFATAVGVGGLVSHRSAADGSGCSCSGRFAPGAGRANGSACRSGRACGRGAGARSVRAMTVTTDPEIRRELIDTVRRFIAREVIPVASRMEHADEFPTEIVEQMKSLGLFGITVPEEYGGLGLDLLTYIGVVEELAYGWMSLSGIVNTHTIAAYLLVHHGSEEQKQRWLPRLVTGELRGCLSLSESDAGSDTRNLSCRAVRDGDEYVINGTKMWVTNGERAGLVALAARTEAGICCFIVEKEPGPVAGGITVSRNIGKLGYKGIETVEMSYVDHRVPAGSLLGEEGRGLSYILGALEVGRINIAARARWASPAPRSTCRSPTRASARRWARPSRSTRRSS